MNTRIISLFSIALIMLCISPSATAGTQLYKPRVDYEIGDDVRCTAIADLDGDGVQDLIVANGARISVLLGFGNGTFLPPVEFSGGLKRLRWMI